MSMLSVQQSFLPRRANRYIPGMQYSNDVSTQGQMRVSFGSPATNNSVGILALTPLFGGTLNALTNNGVAGGSDITTNGNFAANPINASQNTAQNGWSWSIAGGTSTVVYSAGAVVLTGDATNKAELDTNGALVTVPGRQYTITFDATGVVGNVTAGIALAGATLLNAATIVGVAQTATFVATTATTWIGFNVTIVGGMTVDNVSVTMNAIAPFVSTTLDATYGRCLQIVASAASAAVLTFDGYDFYDQPMSENMTLNGTTAVAGLKAWKNVLQITCPVGGVLFSVGWGSRMGVPYKMHKAICEEFNGTPNAAIGTIVAPPITVQTATTFDPRGVITPASAINGTNLITEVMQFCNDVDALNRGGLHGMPHFANAF